MESTDRAGLSLSDEIACFPEKALVSAGWTPRVIAAASKSTFPRESQAEPGPKSSLTVISGIRETRTITTHANAMVLRL